MLLRRSAAVLTASFLLGTGVLSTGLSGLGTAPAAFAAPSPSPSAETTANTLPDGLYGTNDPQYDGVWRQSLALLAQDAVGTVPADQAVTWLADQQCADGSFAAYRADPAAACGPKTVADVNATAAAVQALAALGGHTEAVTTAVDWLVGQQNEDGGWAYAPGGASDANSVAVVIGALVAAGEDPAKTRPGADGPSAYEALAGFQLDCAAPAAQRGAFAYQPEKKTGDLVANEAATVAATLAALGQGLAVKPPTDDADTPIRPLTCPAQKGAKTEPGQVADGGAAYLARTLKDGGEHLVSALPGSEEQPDYGNTALAVTALAAGGHHTAAERSLAWLEQHAGGWETLRGDPAALAYLVLSAHATGSDPAAFGDLDLVTLLNATGPAPRSNGSADNRDSAGRDSAADGEEDSGGLSAGWYVLGVGVLIVVVLAGALALRARKRNS